MYIGSMHLQSDIKENLMHFYCVYRDVTFINLTEKLSIVHNIKNQKVWNKWVPVMNHFSHTKSDMDIVS